MGSRQFDICSEWLVRMLKNESNSSVERSGAAQGLAELVAAYGKEIMCTCILQGYMIIENCIFISRNVYIY